MLLGTSLYMSFHVHVRVIFMDKSLRIELLNYKLYVWSTSVDVINFQNDCANEYTNHQVRRIPIPPNFWQINLLYFSFSTEDTYIDIYLIVVLIYRPLIIIKAEHIYHMYCHLHILFWKVLPFFYWFVCFFFIHK